MEQIREQLNRLLANLLNGQPFGWNNVLDIVIVAVFIYTLRGPLSVLQSLQ